jgi:thioredoxin reductase
MPTMEMPEFNPKKIADEMIKRMKQAKAFEVKCYVDEAFVFMGKPLPFDLSMKDGLYKCKVIAPTMKDAMKMVSDFMPVIKFVNEENE